MLQALKKPREPDNAMQDEIGTENGVFESGGTVAYCNKYCCTETGRKHQVWNFMRATMRAHKWREFLDFYDPYAARMPGRMTTRKGFL